MKPLLLQMQAFGPFGRRQAIDFTVLGAKTFFLIHGATGSGKTSILDAMCFALFGDSSGEERKAADLRSQHADASTLTEVAFDFSLGERRYRVRRVPEQMRPARRGGDGLVKQAPTAELHALPSDADAAPEPLASGWEKVTRKVVELLGFESRQFRQVIVLPQGRFFEFLKSNSQEREKILQVLFGTELYRRIEEALKRAADDLAREARDCDTQRRALLEQAGVESVQALADHGAGQALALQEAVEARSAAARQEEAARLALQQVLQVATRFAEHDAAQAALVALEDQAPAWAQRRTELEAARRAQGLAAYEKAAAEAQRASKDAAARADTAAKALSGARAAVERAQTERAAREANAPQIEKLSARLTELQALHAAVDALEEARAAHKTAAARETAARTAAQQAEQAAGTAATALEQLRKEQDIAAAAAAPLAACDLQVKQLQEREGLASQQARLRRQVEQSARLVQQRTAAFKSAETAADDAAQVRKATMQRWLAGQAARIAHALHDGEPCPVCGSEQHPARATAADGIVSDEALQAAERAADLAATQKASALAALSEARQAEAAQAAALAALTTSTGIVDAQDIATQLAAAQSSLRAAQAAQARLALVRERLPQAQSQLAAAEQAQANARSALQQAEVDLATARTRLDERVKAVPPSLATRSALDAAVRSTAAERDQLVQALNTARQQHADAQAQAEGARAASEAATHAATEADRIALAKAAAFEAQLHEAQFPDAAAYAAAKREPALIDRLAAELALHEQALAAGRDRARRAQDSLGDAARPDVAAAESTHKEAQRTSEAAVASASQAEAGLQATNALLASLQAIDERYAAIEQRHRVVRDVSDKANGQNGHRMSFQRYVLATLLDEVLAATTQRLRVMSRGRYEMRRRREAADSRSAGGLDLEVFDHYTGRERGVQTLSGGEAFLASLALALGLSDVVQSYAGGIRLDAIFVDEGFGTLDPEALDFAVRTLKDLQQAGRMVGIISHVAELKGWIDARLEVKPSQAGSEAAFVV